MEVLQVMVAHQIKNMSRTGGTQACLLVHGQAITFLGSAIKVTLGAFGVLLGITLVTLGIYSSIT
jgi:hypothetical protein